MSRINLTEYHDRDIFFLSKIPKDPRRETIYVAQKDDEIENISVCFYNRKTFNPKYKGFITFSLTSKQIENFPELKDFKQSTITDTKFGAFIKEECARQSLAYEFKSLMDKAINEFEKTKLGKGAQKRDLEASPSSMGRFFRDCPWLNYGDVLEEINKTLKGPFTERQTETLVQILSHWLRVLSRPNRDIDLNLLNIILGKIKTLVDEQAFAKIVVDNVNIVHILNSHSTYEKTDHEFTKKDSKSLCHQQLNIFKTLPAELLKHFSIEQLQSLFIADPQKSLFLNAPFVELSDEMRRLVKEKIHNESGSLLMQFPSNERVYAYFKSLKFEEKESLKYDIITITHRGQCFEFLKKLSKKKKDDAQPDKHLAQLAGQFIELDDCLQKTKLIALEYKGQNSKKIKLLKSILNSLNDLYLGLSKGKSIDTSVVYEKIIDARKQLKELHGSWIGRRSKMEAHFDKYYGQLFMRYASNYQGKPGDNILNSFLNNQITFKKMPLESKQAMEPVLTNPPPAINPDLEGSMCTYSPTRSENKMASAPPAPLYPVLDTPEPQTINLNLEARIDSPQMVAPTAPPPSLYPVITQALDVSQLSVADGMPPAYNPAYLQEIQTSGSEETLTVPAEECLTEILQQACNNIIRNLTQEIQESPDMDVETKKNEMLAVVKYPKFQHMLQVSIEEWMAARKEKQSQPLEQKTIASPVLEKQPVSKSEPVIPEPDSKQIPAQGEKVTSTKDNRFQQSVSALITLKTTASSKKIKKTDQQHPRVAVLG